MNHSPEPQGFTGASGSGNTPFPAYAYSNHIPLYDASCDASDEWDVVMDPEVERGDHVEALFLIGTDYDSTYRDLGHGRFRETEISLSIHTLIGFTVESREFIRFVDREEVKRIIGEARITTLQDAMDREANE